MQMGETGSFSVLTWNVNGMIPTLPNIKLKHKSLQAFVEQLDVDCICFQEMKMAENKMTAEIACVEGYESFWATSQARQSYSGVTTWTRSPPWSPAAAWVDDLGASVGAGPDLDREGRLVIIDLGTFVVANVYVPNAGDRPARARLNFKCRFLEALRARMCQYKLQGREVIIVGDFNVAPERRDMHQTYNYDQIYDAQELKLLHLLLEEFPDVWRLQHPDTTDCYTVWEERTSARTFNAGTRIDLILVSPGLLPHVESCEIIPDMPPKWSDHAPVVLRLKDIRVPAAPKQPCPQSSRRMKRFSKGLGIKAMFAAAAAPANKKQKTTGNSEDRQSVPSLPSLRLQQVGTHQAPAGNSKGSVNAVSSEDLPLQSPGRRADTTSTRDDAIRLTAAATATGMGVVTSSLTQHVVEWGSTNAQSTSTNSIQQEMGLGVQVRSGMPATASHQEAGFVLQPAIVIGEEHQETAIAASKKQQTAPDCCNQTQAVNKEVTIDASPSVSSKRQGSALLDNTQQTGVGTPVQSRAKQKSIKAFLKRSSSPQC